MSLGGRFFGSYEHALDAKGRVILPAKLRGPFHQIGYLTRHLEHCLALWTSEEFEHEIELRLRDADESPEARNEVREWSASVFEAEIDRQGRMAIPTHLRTYASLTDDVLVIGMINRVELWSPAQWQSKALAQSAPRPSRPAKRP